MRYCYFEGFTPDLTGAIEKELLVRADISINPVNNLISSCTNPL